MTPQIRFSKVLFACLSILVWSSAAASASAQMTEVAQVSDVTEADDSVSIDVEQLTEVVSVQADAIQASIVAIPQPGASALGSFEGAKLEATPFNAAELNLSAVATTITVEPAIAPNNETINALVAQLNNELNNELNSTDALTRLQAADAIWTLTGDRALILPTLTAATTSEDAQIRELANSVIAQITEQTLSDVPVVGKLLDQNAQTRQIAQDAFTVVRSENRSSAILGIVARESRKRLLPRALRVITDLF